MGVPFDENLTWKGHNSCINSIASKNIGLLYKVPFGDKFSKQLYFSFIYSYINYASITWASPQKGKLNGLLRKQKHASKTI